MTVNPEMIRQAIHDHRRVLNRLESHLGCVECRGPLTDGRCPVCDPDAYDEWAERMAPYDES